MTTKERLHQLVDQLTENELPAAERALTAPFLLALLNTPEGEGPLTKEEIAGLLEAKKDVETGRVKSFSSVEQLLNDLDK